MKISAFILFILIGTPSHSMVCSVLPAGTTTGVTMPYLNTCGVDLVPNSPVAALNLTGDGDVLYCGACIQVTGPVGTGVFPISEHCRTGECNPANKILLSSAAALQVSGISSGFLPGLTYNIVPCPRSGPMNYQVLNSMIGSSSQLVFLQIRPGNYIYPIQEIKVRTVDNSFVTMTRGLGNRFTFSSTGAAILTPFVELQIIDSNGGMVTDYIEHYTSDYFDIWQAGSIQNPVCSYTLFKDGFEAP